MLHSFRLWLRNRLDVLADKWKKWKQAHPKLVRTYTIISWIALIVFLISLLFFKPSRFMATQFLWSLYLIVQFWLLARTKTLFWQEYVRFFLVGAWVIAPLTGTFVFLFHEVFGGSASSLKSSALLTPVVEEMFKLIPLGVYLFISRRASALSLSDYALIGAASGAGFQFVEEATRRIQSTDLISQAWGGYGHSWFGETIHWDFFSLFPGYFEEEILPTKTTASHAVLTALVVVGIGLASRLSRKYKFGKVAYVFPGFLLFWAILDHGIWNGSGMYPQWMQNLHDLLGSGYNAKTIFMFLLALAIGIDSFHFNRVKSQLPLLHKETIINPLTELFRLVQSFFKPKRLGYLLLFYRERRQLAMTILFGEEEEKRKVGPIGEIVRKRSRQLAALTGIVLVLFAGMALHSVTGGVPVAGGAATDGYCFACMFDELFRWWDNLEWYEQGLVTAGVIALSWLAFGGIWSALAIGSTFASVAGSGREVGRFLRHPWQETQAYWEWWEDLTPRERVEIAGHVALSQLLSRIGLGVAKKGLGLARKGKKPPSKGGKQTEGTVQPVSNMNEFFKTDFGKTIGNSLSKTKMHYDGQSIYKVSQKTSNPYLKKGYGVYLDALHKDHLEVIDKQGKVKYVLNLDGSFNPDKTKKALGRVVQSWK